MTDADILVSIGGIRSQNSRSRVYVDTYPVKHEQSSYWLKRGLSEGRRGKSSWI